MSCHEIKYNISYSLTKWPSDHSTFDGDLAYCHIVIDGFFAYLQSLHSEEEHRRGFYKDFFKIKRRKVGKKQPVKLIIYFAGANELINEKLEK